MTVWVDAAGNLRGLWRPESSTSAGRLVIGSHIDSVPGAGAFDGVLGVVMALELVSFAQADSLRLPIEVIAFSEEEGVRFGTPFLGSRAVAGSFDPQLLNLCDRDGVSMADCIRAFGLNPDEIPKAELGSDAAGYLELHIEQGPMLESEGLQVGVVTAVVGQSRCEILFTGQANHAGTTPIGAAQRCPCGSGGMDSRSGTSSQGLWKSASGIWIGCYGRERRR